jgi:hypothetical protein
MSGSLNVADPSDADEYDPFDAFDRSNGADLVRDPYPDWAEARARCGVIEGDVRLAMGIGEPPPPDPDAPAVFTLLSFEAVATALRDDRFSSQSYGTLMGEVMATRSSRWTSPSTTPTAASCSRPSRGRRWTCGPTSWCGRSSTRTSTRS